MGLKLRDIIIRKEIAIDDLSGRKLMVDSYNILYQFLASIRQRDGTPLMDSEGNVTSHLSGLFSRTTKLMQKGLKLGFVFDGKPPKLKAVERERRREAKKEAEKQYEIAKDREDIEGMKKYAQRTSVLTREMVQESKELIAALGLPVIQAPCEGEAQAAYIVNKGEAYAEISQDFDSLMFKVPKLVQNLTVSEKRKLPGKSVYQSVKPLMIDLKENLKELGINQEQLIMIGILIGTDYNSGGIKGIGQKKALELVKKYKDDYGTMFKEARWEEYFDIPWKEIYDVINNMKTTDDYVLKWKRTEPEMVIEILCEKHDFSRERVESALEKLESNTKKQNQKGLGDFF